MSERLNKCVTVELTATDIAMVLCNADSDFQAEVLSEIADLCAKWNRPFEFQLEYLKHSQGLSPAARLFMELLGEYAKEAERDEKCVPEVRRKNHRQV